MVLWVWYTTFDVMCVFVGCVALGGGLHQSEQLQAALQEQPHILSIVLALEYEVSSTASMC